MSKTLKQMKTKTISIRFLRFFLFLLFLHYPTFLTCTVHCTLVYIFLLYTCSNLFFRGGWIFIHIYSVPTYKIIQFYILIVAVTATITYFAGRFSIRLKKTTILLSPSMYNYQILSYFTYEKYLFYVCTDGAVTLQGDFQ